MDGCPVPVFDVAADFSNETSPKRRARAPRPPRRDQQNYLRSEQNDTAFDQLAGVGDWRPVDVPATLHPHMRGSESSAVHAGKDGRVGFRVDCLLLLQLPGCDLPAWTPDDADPNAAITQNKGVAPPAPMLDFLLRPGSRVEGVIGTGPRLAKMMAPFGVVTKHDAASEVRLLDLIHCVLSGRKLHSKGPCSRMVPPRIATYK